MEQLLNQTFKVDNTEISAYHMTDERKNNFQFINARWSSGELSLYVSADFKDYNIICNKHPELTSTTRTKLFLSFIDNGKRQIVTRYMLDTCDYELKIPRLDVDSFATRNVYHLYQDSKGYYETLDALESMLMTDEKMDKTTAMIIAYAFEQMRSETPDYHSRPEFFNKLIKQGYSKSKKINNPFEQKKKEKHKEVEKC